MATFYIQTDKQYYTAGQQVNGSVYVDVPATIKNTQGLRLIFRSAKQSLNYGQGFQMKNGQTPQSNQVQQYENMVEMMPAGVIEAGKYKFPFSIQTNQNTKNSQEISDIIEYELIVAIMPLNVKFQLKEVEQVFFISNSSYQSHKFTQNITSFFCFDKGPCQYQVQLNKKAYKQKQIGQIVVNVDNSQCSADVEGLTFRVVSILNHHGQVKSNAVEKNINFQVKNKQSSIKSMREQFQIPASDSYSHIQGANHSVRLEIQLRHGGMCQENRTFEIPIVLLPDFSESKKPVFMSQNWKPRLMKSVSFKEISLSCKERYG